MAGSTTRCPARQERSLTLTYLSLASRGWQALPQSGPLSDQNHPEPPMTFVASGTQLFVLFRSVVYLKT